VAGRRHIWRWPEQPLTKGTTVLVFNAGGERTVDVMQWIDALDDLAGKVSRMCERRQ
jgi:hypothetical protein